MKPNAIPYTVSARNVDTNPETTVTVTFESGHTFEGPIGTLLGWAKSTDTIEINRKGERERRLGANTPSGCFINGIRHGIYPCLMALDPEAALAISVALGRRIEVGDGATLYNRSQLLEAVDRMTAAGLELKAGMCAWGVTRTPHVAVTAPNPVVDAIKEVLSSELKAAAWLPDLASLVAQMLAQQAEAKKAATKAAKAKLVQV